MTEYGIERQKILDHGHRMMDAIKAVHGEGDMFFAAMAVMVEQLEDLERRRMARAGQT